MDAATELKRGMAAGAVAGALWGALTILVNLVTNVFPLEDSILYNMSIAAIGGAVFGVVVGAIFSVTRSHVPLKGIVPKAAFVSTAVWLVLRTGGYFLSQVDPVRYHQVMSHTIQGFFLSILMGCILGVAWKISGGKEEL
jgi:hypothetical protein